jgi:hypothetical protein
MGRESERGAEEAAKARTSMKIKDVCLKKVILDASRYGEWNLPVRIYFGNRVVPNFLEINQFECFFCDGERIGGHCVPMFYANESRRVSALKKHDGITNNYHLVGVKRKQRNV